jgi:hypothetical protein
MATLRRSTREFSFSEYQRLQPTSPPPGNELDGAFHELREELRSTQEALAQLRRDDGQLRNELVGPEQLKPALITNITGDVKKITDLLTGAVRNAISTHTITANDISLLARDAEAAAMAARTWLSQAEQIATRLQLLADEVAIRASGVDTTATDAENWANYAEAQSDNAIAAKNEALQWAEYLAGPVVSGPDAPAYIAGSPFPHGLFYQPVEGVMAAGLWSAKWWAIHAQNLVGWTSFYYLGAWPYPPAPGSIHPDTGKPVGDPLAPGSIYYDESTGDMMVWTGESWVAPFSLTGAVTSRFTYKATAGQTVFSGADMFTRTPTIEAGNEHDVHVNGIKLVRDDGTLKGDYTVNQATSTLTLLSPVTVNSVVQWDVLVNPAKLAPAAGLLFKCDTIVPDGVKTVFTITYNSGAGIPTISKPSELMVLVDGVQQEPGFDFNASGQTLTMTVAPLATSRIWAKYFKSAV